MKTQSLQEAHSRQRKAYWL